MIYSAMLFFSLKREELIKKHYYNAGLHFGRVTSYMVYDIPSSYSNDLQAWEFWEEKYSALGYKTISFNEWSGLGGWKEKLQSFNMLRDKDEEPILHAKKYRQDHPNGPVSLHIASHVLENAKPGEVYIYEMKQNKMQRS